MLKLWFVVFPKSHPDNTEVVPKLGWAGSAQKRLAGSIPPSFELRCRYHKDAPVWSHWWQNMSVRIRPSYRKSFHSSLDQPPITMFCRGGEGRRRTTRIKWCATNCRLSQIVLSLYLFIVIFCVTCTVAVVTLGVHSQAALNSSCPPIPTQSSRMVTCLFHTLQDLLLSHLR